MATKVAEDPMLAFRKTMLKKYDVVVAPMNELVQDAKFLTTGNIALDYIMGGGIPLGRSVELYGPPGCGKSTTTLQTAVALQKVIKAGGDKERGIFADDAILFLDFEQAMDIEYAKMLGLDVDHPSFLYSSPDTLEDGANIADAFFETGRGRLCVVDSVAAMQPSAKAAAEVGKQLPGLTARLLKEWGVGLNGILARNNASIIFLNHLIDKFDMGGGRPGMPTPTTTPGGIAMKFFASVRVKYSPMASQLGNVRDPITKELVPQKVSTDVKVVVEKNRVAPPFRRAVVRVRFGKGFDNFWTAIQILLADKKIIYASPMYKFHNLEALPKGKDLVPEWMPHMKQGTMPPAIQGEKRLIKVADLKPEWRQAIIELAEETVFNNIAVFAAEERPAEEVDDDDEDDFEAEAAALDEASGELTGEGRRVQL
jgi:recombination protein RecA